MSTADQFWQGRDCQQRLVEEAEAGLDPAALVPRRSGRPSLSCRSGWSSQVDLPVDDETYASIGRIADQHHRDVRDVAREAVVRASFVPGGGLRIAGRHGS
jgi:hypothetical protein